MANETPRKTTPAAAPSSATAADQTPATTDPATTTTSPAGAAVADAVRAAETASLTEQRDRLRKLIGEAPTLDLLRAEVDALQQIAARAGQAGPTRWTMSAGVANDLETLGYAVDPGTGAAYVKDGNRVKVTARDGATRTMAMPTPPPTPGTEAGKE